MSAEDHPNPGGGDYRKELLPVALDHIANEEPNRDFAWIARDENLENGFWKPTFYELAMAADRAAWWLERTLGKPAGFPTVTYIGVADLRYYALLLGCMKVGYKMMFPSLANSVEAIRTLMADAKSETFLYSSASDTAASIVAQIDQSCQRVPEIDQFFRTDLPAEHYPFGKTPLEAAHDPVCIFHTSGTTGFPKVRVMTNAHLATRQSAAHPPSSSGRPGITRSSPEDRRRIVLGSMGYVSMLLGLIGPIWGGRLSIMAPLHLSQPHYTPSLFRLLATEAEATSAFIFPKLAIDLAKNQASLQVLDTLQHVSYGGGPLPEAVSAKLSARTQLNSCWSSTETGVLAFQAPDDDARECVVVDTPELNLDFVASSPGLYELCITREPGHPDQTFGWHQAVFDMFPEQSTFRTGDLFSQHPTKPYHWQPQGRVDDIIILSLGNSVNPGPTEQACTGCPGVKEAVGFGQMKPTLGLLIEFEDELVNSHNQEAVQRVLEGVWKALDTVNARRQGFERVLHNRVVFATPEKPLPRSSKGLVQRKRCIQLYQTEIDACYGADPRNGADQGAPTSFLDLFPISLAM